MINYDKCTAFNVLFYEWKVSNTRFILRRKARKTLVFAGFSTWHRIAWKRGACQGRVWEKSKSHKVFIPSALPFLSSPALLHYNPSVKSFKPLSRQNPGRDKGCIDRSRAQSGKPGQRNRHHGSRYYYSQDTVESGGVAAFKQRIHRSGQADDCDEGSDSPRHKDRQAEAPDSVHKRRVQAQRHQERGKAHPRRDKA